MAKKEVEQPIEQKEEIKVEIKPFELNLDLGRQDLNDNFRKIQDAINELRK